MEFDFICYNVLFSYISLAEREKTCLWGLRPGEPAQLQRLVGILKSSGKQV